MINHDSGAENCSAPIDFVFDDIAADDAIQDYGIIRMCVPVIFLLDTDSGILPHNQRIQQLNVLMPTIFAALMDRAVDCEIDIKIYVFSFSSKTGWALGDENDGVSIFNAHDSWKGLSDETDLAGAIRQACAVLRNLRTMTHYAAPPSVILVSDAKRSNSAETKAAMEELKQIGPKHLRGQTYWVRRFAVCEEGITDSAARDFAMTGCTEDEWGNEITGVPLVFSLNDVDQAARKLAQGITPQSLLDDDWSPNRDDTEAPSIIISI